MRKSELAQRERKARVGQTSTLCARYHYSTDAFPQRE